MKLKKLLSLDFVVRFSNHLESDFERNLYIASLRNYASHGNPLRFHNFAFSIRELITHIINKKAPDEKVMKASWYVKDNDYKDVSRRQQLKYCAQIGISDEYLGQEIIEDIQESLREMAKNYLFLNKFTHISEKSLTPSPKVFFDNARSVIETATEIIETLENCRNELIYNLENKIRDAVQDTATSTEPEELSIIANHAYVNYAELEENNITSIDDEYIYIHASGLVNVTQEYGSHNDGVSLEEDYPFTLEMRSRLDSPERFEILSEALNVDTSSWYEDPYAGEDSIVTEEQESLKKNESPVEPEEF